MKTRRQLAAMGLEINPDQGSRCDIPKGTPRTPVKREGITTFRNGNETFQLSGDFQNTMATNKRKADVSASAFQSQTSASTIASTEAGTASEATGSSHNLAEFAQQKLELAPAPAEWGVKRRRSSERAASYLQKLPEGVHVGVNVSYALVQKHFEVIRDLKKVKKNFSEDTNKDRYDLEVRVLQKESDRVWNLILEQQQNCWAERPTEPAWCQSGARPHTLAFNLHNALKCKPLPEGALRLTWRPCTQDVSTPSKKALQCILSRHLRDEDRVAYILNAFLCDPRLRVDSVLAWIYRLSTTGVIMTNNPKVSFAFLDCLFEACHRLHWSEPERAEATIETALTWLERFIATDSDLGNVTLLLRACTDRRYGDDVLFESLQWLTRALERQRCPSLSTFQEVFQNAAQRQFPHKFMKVPASRAVTQCAEQMRPRLEDESKAQAQGLDYYTRNDVRTAICLLRPGNYKLRNIRTILSVALPERKCMLSVTKLGFCNKRSLIKGLFAEEMADGRLSLEDRDGHYILTKRSGLGLSGNDTPPVFVRPQPPCFSPPPPPDTPPEKIAAYPSPHEDAADNEYEAAEFEISIQTDFENEGEEAVFSDNPSAMDTCENSPDNVIAE